jgi:hypothetical protein
MRAARASRRTSRAEGFLKAVARCSAVVSTRFGVLWSRRRRLASAMESPSTTVSVADVAGVWGVDAGSCNSAATM